MIPRKKNALSAKRENANERKLVFKINNKHISESHIMKINEILKESQQINEGPIAQAVGNVGGKIAKGVTDIGKDLKTGFKAGYSGKKPPVKPAAKKPGLLSKIGQAVGDFKAGFQQGSGQPAKPAAATASNAAPAANNSTAAAEKQSKIGVGQINKIIPTLRTRDLMSLQTNLEKAIASKKQKSTTATAQDDVPINPATGKPLTEPERAAHQAAGGQFDGETGAPLPLGTPAAQTASPEPTQQSTAQAATAAQAAGEDPEQAALAAMQKKNPNLQKLAARSKQPVKISGKKKVAAPQQQMASKEPKGTMVAEGFSIFRKH